MTDSDDSDSRFAPSSSTAPGFPLNEELPPVEPPSAGFIVQLFLVPALIVMAVVGVWALFGRIAGGEQDWRSLVAELSSGNEHRRWRAALGLAQMLKGDQEKGDKGQGLARNPQINSELATLLKSQLESQSTREDDLKQQAFLARTLGFLDVPEVVVPVLTEATEPRHDLDVRRNALASLSLVLGRTDVATMPAATQNALVDALIQATQDTELPIRQLGAYALGLIPSESSQQQLELLVESTSEDPTVRANAAVGLARSHSRKGLPFFQSVLKVASTAAAGDSRQYADLVTLRNTIKALELLKAELSDEERADLSASLAQLAANYPDDRIRLDAQEAVQALKR